MLITFGNSSANCILSDQNSCFLLRTSTECRWCPFLASLFTLTLPQKFICTYIRKTKLRFKDLYDHDRCASFVANYITYQPLSNPERLPSVLKSPTATLERQGGNSFEFSLLLTSLLLGVGYDAYCVVGYADKETTLNDQTNVACPLVQETQQKVITEAPSPPLWLANYSVLRNPMLLLYIWKPRMMRV